MSPPAAHNLVLALSVELQSQFEDLSQLNAQSCAERRTKSGINTYI